ncbi:hypothetical protein RFI_33970 [Reticulomyxa filosa]|uniref:Uncharacterized protein n=1 Tax=Reticulomyxa filosa TaxID=46433 RepID=X6LQN1_RETFI|nr:hypothetical protein RFI_33970 [Reticulomyxa filosa]|eukprot:ETO03437.1 hypothetical protein RFI_33970 [Reticulomyxa filosa]
MKFVVEMIDYIYKKKGFVTLNINGVLFKNPKTNKYQESLHSNECADDNKLAYDFACSACNNSIYFFETYICGKENHPKGNEKKKAHHIVYNNIMILKELPTSFRRCLNNIFCSYADKFVVNYAFYVLKGEINICCNNDYNNSISFKIQNQWILVSIVDNATNNSQYKVFNDILMTNYINHFFVCYCYQQ